LALVNSTAALHTGAEEGEDEEGGEETEAAVTGTKLFFSWLRLSSMSPGVGAALENFPLENRKNSFGAPENSFTYSYVVTTSSYLSPFLKVHAHRPWCPLL
jgi:hypothetical protein